MPDPREPVLLGVEPDTELLEGINQVLERVEQRRKATPVSSRVFNRKDLLTESNQSALGFVESRTPLQVYACGLGVECTRAYGGFVPISVYVDEALVQGGTDYLRAHQPYDFQRIEVFGNGQQIRVYTEGYLKWAGESHIVPALFIS